MKLIIFILLIPIFCTGQSSKVQLDLDFGNSWGTYASDPPITVYKNLFSPIGSIQGNFVKDSRRLDFFVDLRYFERNYDKYSYREDWFWYDNLPEDNKYEMQRISYGQVTTGMRFPLVKRERFQLFQELGIGFGRRIRYEAHYWNVFKEYWSKNVDSSGRRVMGPSITVALDLLCSMNFWITEKLGVLIRGGYYYYLRGDYTKNYHPKHDYQIRLGDSNFNLTSGVTFMLY